MNELMSQLSTYARTTWRYRWFTQMIAWPLCLIGWLVVYLLPNQYDATARVYIDTQSMLRPLLQGLAVQTNVSEQIQAMLRTLLSRPNLEKVARMSDLDMQAKTPEEMELLLNRLGKKIVLSNAGRENLFSISYTYEKPEVAKQVVQSLLTVFVESSLGDTRKDTSAAQQFIDEQIKEYEEKLSSAEDRLKDFKRQNMNVMPSEGRGYYERLQSETAILERAKLELWESENRRDELHRQLDGEEPTFGLMTAEPIKTTVSATDTRIQALQTKLDELLLRYTDEHPDVTSLRKQISELQEQDKKKRESQAAASPVRPTTLEANPVYQRLKIALGEAEANVASLRVRVKEYSNRIAQLNKLVDTVPQVEAELARLNRDYAINKQNYETLIARRESAKISESAEQSSDALKFKIVDPPRVSLKPVAPNRPLLASAVLVAGLGMGIFFAFFLSQLKPTFDHHRAIVEATNVPVLGYVSMVSTGAARNKRRVEVLAFSAMTVGLFVVFGFYVAMQVLANSPAR
ncbi:MAG: chain length-determining protein [Gammaproteobacteria bacterium]|nr:chain length-determining protein [Gammaproteobacteria bacterium]